MCLQKTLADKTHTSTHNHTYLLLPHSKQLLTMGAGQIKLTKPSGGKGRKRRREGQREGGREGKKREDKKKLQAFPEAVSQLNVL